MCRNIWVQFSRLLNYKYRGAESILPDLRSKEQALSTFINWHMNLRIDEDHKNAEHMCPPLEGKCSRFTVFIYFADKVPALFDYESYQVLTARITITWLYNIMLIVFELWVRKMSIHIVSDCDNLFSHSFCLLIKM